MKSRIFIAVSVYCDNTICIFCNYSALWIHAEGTHTILIFFSLIYNLEIPTNSSRVDIGVRVELPAEVFAPITDELYESKFVFFV